MRITHLRIGHFGKLHNIELDFGERLNVVLGPNESGKSTIHAFIGAMLFGLDRSRGRAGKDDLYTKYKPWDTPGSYQGSLDFEHEGTNYRITRVFYQKEKSCSCTNLDTGRPVNLPDDSITSIIPSLTKSAYYNTVSMGQSALRCAADFGGEVHNYIANLATSKESRIDVSDATKRLSKKVKELQKQIKDIDSEISESEEEIAELKLGEERIAKLEADRIAASERVEELVAAYEAMQTDLPDATAANGRWRTLNDETEELRTVLNQKHEAFDAAQDELDSLRLKLDEHEDSTRKNIEVQRSKNAKLRTASLIIAACGVIVCVLGNGRSVPAIAAGVALLAVGIVILTTKFIKNREIQKAQKSAELERADIEESIRNASKEADEAEVNYNSAIADYRSKNDELKKASEELSAISTEREKHIDAERRKNAEIAAARAALERAEGGIEAIGDIGNSLFEEEEKLFGLTERRTALDSELAAYSLALGTIESLSQNIHDSFSSEFGDILSEEICLATDGRYSVGRVSDNLDIEVMSGIDYISAEQLSTGASEQLYIALRFAVARLFFKDIDVPVFLDESFAYSDDERLKSVMSAIAERENGQIVIFSCIGREAQLLKELGAEYKEILLG